MPAPSAIIYLTSAALAVLLIGVVSIFVARRYRRLHGPPRLSSQKLPSWASPPPSSPPPLSIPRQTGKLPAQHHRPSMQEPRHSSPPRQSMPSHRTGGFQVTTMTTYIKPSGEPWSPLPPPTVPLPVPPDRTYSACSPRPSTSPSPRISHLSPHIATATRRTHD